jgi:hypothetical protein
MQVVNCKKILNEHYLTIGFMVKYDIFKIGLGLQYKNTQKVIGINPRKAG